MRDSIDIPAVSAATVTRSMRGRMIAIDDDVQSIAKQIADIDPSLSLYHAIDENTYVVVQNVHEPDGSVTEKFVTAMQGGLDQRILQRVRELAARDYDLVAELNEIDRKADARDEHERLEKVGPVAEKLLHAIRKDLDLKGSRAYIR